jgi:Transposase DDE domain
MSTVARLAKEIALGLKQGLPGLRTSVVRKLSLAVGAMIEGQTPNTVELANLLPLATERQDMREQWLRRLLKSPALCCDRVMEPFIRAALHKAAQGGQTLLLALDQTDLGDRMAVLMVALCLGGRSLPLAWLAAEGPANIGFAQQQAVLERVLACVPPGVCVVLMADRFYPSAGLLQWLQAQGWGYRLRLKSNLVADPGFGDVTTTGELAAGVTERHLSNVCLFADGEVFTNLGILHEPGHAEPWIVAMDCPPTRAAVLDYGSRWSIEPTFSDFKSRGFDLGDSQLVQADRLENLILIMALAMHWCVRVGQDEALKNPTPLEKKRNSKATLGTGASKSCTAAWSPGSRAGCGT